MKKIADVTITGFNLKSIKKFIIPKKPLKAELMFEELPANNNTFFIQYELLGENVHGFWYPDGCHKETRGTYTLLDHQTIMKEQNGWKKLITTSGLAQYRTTLKYIYNSGTLEVVADLKKFDKINNEIFSVEWVTN